MLQGAKSVEDPFAGSLVNQYDGAVLRYGSALSTIPGLFKQCFRYCVVDRSDHSALASLLSNHPRDYVLKSAERQLPSERDFSDGISVLGRHGRGAPVAGILGRSCFAGNHA